MTSKILPILQEKALLLLVFGKKKFTYSAESFTISLGKEIVSIGFTSTPGETLAFIGCTIIIIAWKSCCALPLLKRFTAC